MTGRHGCVGIPEPGLARLSSLPAKCHLPYSVVTSSGVARAGTPAPPVECFISPEAAMLAATPDNSDPRDPPHIALVLIVDDDANLRRITATILSQHGYDVVEAADGLVALACLVKWVPDLVILDLHMPRMNGWEFRAEQRELADERLAAIPVLLLTGEAAPEHEARRLHAAGLVHKPYDPDDLLGAVSAALRRVA